MLVLSAWSFKFIPKVFVPALDKQYFTLDMWLPEGTQIEETDKMATEMADFIRGQEEAEMVSTEGHLRVITCLMWLSDLNPIMRRYW